MVQSIRRALGILEAVSEVKSGIGVTELSKRVGLSTSTTHRLLVALQEDGYVSQDIQSERYRLGSRVLDLAHRALNGTDLRRIAQPYLEELRNRTSETAHLMVLDSNEVLCIESVESDGHMRVVSPVGMRSALHCSAIGKAILAWLPEEHIRSLVSGGLARYTENTIADEDKLMAHLAEIRSSGVAYDNEERDLGVRCAAAPVFDRAGSVVAAVGISAPAVRFAEEMWPGFSAAVREAAEKISLECGM